MQRQNPPRGLESLIGDGPFFRKKGTFEARVRPGCAKLDNGFTRHRQKVQALAARQLDLEIKRKGRHFLPVFRNLKCDRRAKSVGERTPAGSRFELENLAAKDEIGDFAETLRIGDSKRQDRTVPLDVLRSHAPPGGIERREGPSNAQTASIENDFVDRAISDLGLEGATDLERFWQLMHPTRAF